MEVLETQAAGIVKRAIKIFYPVWRQVGSSDEAEKPPIIIVEIGEVPHAVAAGTEVDVFDAGHLGMAEPWQEGGRGAAVKSSAGAKELRSVGEGQIMGFVHFHRNITTNTGAIRAAQKGSPIALAVKFFTEYEGEFSAFVPVIFERSDNRQYPWRVLPPP